ncbi:MULTISPECIES: hypothetical protein [Lysinibacillus]|uniref:Uncharacterized protein n=2 Tax=Lysinibacillus sphaericus TaxID=1421 RepID=A0A6H0A0V0_LYSSH|nr:MULTISPECIES: hypothetical protein [Lysinibacillus]MBE5085749.1 hypothetical protein [Bacillus thuringiensis]ACA42240.1 hypothetical protein Bsph_p010 [Lysinibacillus sphaericus C3-41]AMO35384.1 hypothetical protein AR327_23115 [Lysinibacillus sphaericus]AMR93013.1 hypothetical protein A1T07_22670 [Lysinibacillus sphaericus]AMR93184.1 hypothetical protein A1T07_23545 [Lysinibacillus sphaericus]
METAPQEIFDLTLAKKTENEKELENAYRRIPDEYHDFIVLLEQKIKITDSRYFLAEEFITMGAYQDEKGIYLKIKKPYMTVDGRIRMARDEHSKKEAKLIISEPQIIQVGNRICMNVTVESEIHGTATGTIEVNINGFGVDKKNPVANAQTSALGRALGFLGYGIIGTAATASLDEATNLYNSLFASPSKEQVDPKKPEIKRVRICGPIEYKNNDLGYVQIQLETEEYVIMQIGKSLFRYENILVTNAVVKVRGWWNGEIFAAAPDQDIILDQNKKIVS